MIDFIMKKVEQSDRNSIIYIHPVSSEETISKYIGLFKFRRRIYRFWSKR